MIQRAGRIDRIGSKFNKIHIYNFFPEDELEDLLKLVNILQEKIVKIDQSVGLDSTVLGEKINPKVFGVIRKIKEEKTEVMDELETDAFGGGELFYQPLKNYLREKSREELEQLPHGIHSGLQKKTKRGVFFYYKYKDSFHFWYLYDLESGDFIKNKSEILRHIQCTNKAERIIPNFFDKVYEANKLVVKDIEETYKDLELKKKDSQLVHMAKDRTTKFINVLVKELHADVDKYMDDYPNDTSIETEWDEVAAALGQTSMTKKRIQVLRKIKQEYAKSGNWKKAIKQLAEFVKDKHRLDRGELDEYNEKSLKLICVDFIS
jgi:hypothetical protein